LVLSPVKPEVLRHVRQKKTSYYIFSLFTLTGLSHFELTQSQEVLATELNDLVQTLIKSDANLSQADTKAVHSTIAGFLAVYTNIQESERDRENSSKSYPIALLSAFVDFSARFVTETEQHSHLKTIIHFLFGKKQKAFM
jgi:hypothetical protein